jgi:hypothetical protein
MYVGSDFQVTVRDYPYNPRLVPRANEPRIVRRRRGPGTSPLYYIYIRLEGPDVPLVRGVRYIMHPTVSPREPYVERIDSNPDCMLELWLWGTFETRATVFDIRGRTLPLPPHYLQFDTYFQEDKFRQLGLVIRDEGAMSA